MAWYPVSGVSVYLRNLSIVLEWAKTMAHNKIWLDCRALSCAAGRCYGLAHASPALWCREHKAVSELA